MANKIEIPLKSTIGIQDKKLPQNFRSIVENEYSVRYLDSFGANPTRENLEFVSKHASITESVLLPVWTKNTLVILPNRSDDPETIDLKEIFKPEIIDAKGEKDMEKNHKLEKLLTTKSDLFTPIEKKKSYNELIALKKSTYNPDSKANWRSESIAYNLKDLISNLKLKDLSHKDFVDINIKKVINDESVLSIVRKYLKLLKEFVPILKKDRDGNITILISKLISSKLAIEFYSVLFVTCQQVLLSCGNLSQIFLQKMDRNMYNTVKENIFSITTDLQMKSQIQFNETYEDDNMLYEKDNNVEDNNKILFNLYQRCITVINSKIAINEFSKKAAAQSFVYSSVFVILELLKQNYRWFRTKNYSSPLLDLRKHTFKLVLQVITDVIDPLRIYPMEFLFDIDEVNPSIEKSFFDRKNIKNHKVRQFTTSLPVRAVFESATSHEVRKILNFNKSQNFNSNRPKIYLSSNPSDKKINVSNVRDGNNSSKIDQIDQLFSNFEMNFQSKKSEKDLLGLDKGEFDNSKRFGQSNSTLYVSDDSNSDRATHPRLNGKEKSEVLSNILEKTRSQYIKKSGPEDPRVSYFSPIELASNNRRKTPNLNKR